MPKTETFNREKVLEQALNLFWKKGYEATSLSDLTKELGIGKGSFYNSFGSKRKLFDQCLAIYRSQVFAEMDSALSTKVEPIIGLTNLLNNYTENLLADKYSRGCFLANSTVEMAFEPEIKKFLTEYNEVIKGKIIAFLADSPFADQAICIAETLQIYMTGITLRSKVIKDIEGYKASNELFIKSILN